MKKLLYIYIFAIIVIFSGCKLQAISYGMTGGTIPPEAKSYSVDFFQNKAPIVVPYLSGQFTEKLKEKLRDQFLNVSVASGEWTIKGTTPFTGGAKTLKITFRP